MNKILSAAALLAVSVCGTASAQTSVSINVDQPGLYGQINIGGFAQRPQLIYAQPVLVERPVAYVPAEPIYLHVPSAQYRDWHRYCGHYGACGRPVYFVRDDWYRRVYMPRMRDRPYYDDRGFQDRRHHHEEHGRGGGHGGDRGGDRHHGHGRDHHDHHDHH